MVLKTAGHTCHTALQGMRQQGVYIAPSQFEALFLSTAHTDEHIDATAVAAEEVLKNIVK